MGFVGFYCKYCGKPLPVETKENHKGLLRVWCEKCQRWTYINGVKIVRE